VSEGNKRVVLRFVEEVANRRNLDAIEELLWDDFALPPGGGGSIATA
jgi:hypothetical protein